MAPTAVQHTSFITNTKDLHTYSLSYNQLYGSFIQQYRISIPMILASDNLLRCACRHDVSFHVPNKRHDTTYMLTSSFSYLAIETRLRAPVMTNQL